MIIERFVTPELAQVAYAVGDESAGNIAVIDPRRDVGGYVEWADRRGLKIVAILETHVHADFVSGVLELAAVTGAPVYTSWLGNQTFEHVPVDDGWSLDVGSVRLTALHTPGHTPEHVSWQATDASEPGARPVLFSGDALFVGDVGRPDLLGAGQTDALVRDLYSTVTDVFMALPGETMVYPGHTAGSSCGKNIGSAPHTTIANEKAMNYAFKPGSEAGFARAVMSGMPQPPTYYPVLKRVNTAGAVPLASLGDMNAATVIELEDQFASGAMMVDVRSAEEFSQGHIPGSIFVGVGQNFSTWMGWLAPYDHDVVFVANDAAQAGEALTMARRIGIDRVSGYHVGVEAWRESGRPLATLAVTSPDSLTAARGSETEPTVVDVRNDGEFEIGHIDGAMHHVLGRIARGEMPELDRDRPIVLTCASGYRSTVAASLMLANGFENVRKLTGGMSAWNERNAGDRSIAS